jgi:hypothetical protein
MVDSWIYWSDSVWLYHAVCFGLLALLVALVIWPEASNRTGRLGAAFFLLVLCVFVAGARWPGLFYPRGFNPDEDQLIAAARALVLDPVFFRSAEAGSSGPLNVYPLLLSLPFQHSLTFFTARSIALVMVCVSLVAVYYIGRSVFSESIARLGALLPGLFFGLTNFWDFTHYTSEHMPVMLLAVGWAFMSWAIFREGLEYGYRIGLASCAAVFLSMVPFAKLQASIAAVVSALILLASVLVYAKSWRDCVKGALCICLAGCFLPALLVCFFSCNGVFEYFWTSYIRNALAYQGSGFRGQSGFQMLGMILFAKPPLQPVEFLQYALGWVLNLLIGTVVFLWFRGRSPWRLGIFACWALVLVGLAFYTVVSPQRNYPHYLIFLPIPMGIATIAVIGLAYQKLTNFRSTRRLALIVVALFIGFWPLVFWRLASPNSWVGQARKWSLEVPGLVAQKILAASGGKGPLCVWGYYPNYYSETGLVQATRLCTSGALFNDNSLKRFFIATYLHDLERSKPKVFVDAVAPEKFVMMTKREEHGHEQIPEIRDFVAANYTLFEEIDGVRIYKWKEVQP